MCEKYGSGAGSDLPSKEAAKKKKEREPVDGAGGQGGWGVIHTHKPAGSDSPPPKRARWRGVGPHDRLSIVLID